MPPDTTLRKKPAVGAGEGVAGPEAARREGFCVGDELSSGVLARLPVPVELDELVPVALDDAVPVLLLVLDDEAVPV